MLPFRRLRVDRDAAAVESQGALDARKTSVKGYFKREAKLLLPWLPFLVIAVGFVRHHFTLGSRSHPIGIGVNALSAAMEPFGQA